MNLVPNLFPKIQSDLRLAIVGEAPGRDEEAGGEPFIGTSGRFLSALLSRAGVSREACFFGNVSQHRPRNNNLEAFEWKGPEIQSGLAQLCIDLRKVQPNIVVLLGNAALKAAQDPESNHVLKPKAYKYKIGEWRGSLFVCNHLNSPFYGYKCISTYHPAYVLRDYSGAPILQLDLKKAVRESSCESLRVVSRNLETSLTANDIVERLRQIRRERRLVATDIEGYVGAMSCISFSYPPNGAFVVPFVRWDGTSYWSEDDEALIWRELARVLEDPSVPKILQNSLYDRFVLQYSYNIVVRGVVDDTMLKHWELYCEFEKSLGFQVSLYLEHEPYYKFERKSGNFETFLRYSCKDSAVTYDVNNVLSAHLRGASLEHYKMNVALLNPLLYMELRGIKYNSALAASRRKELLTKLFIEQYELDRLANVGLKEPLTKDGLLGQIHEVMCFKRALIKDWKDCVVYAKKEYASGAANRAVELAQSLLDVSPRPADGMDDKDNYRSRYGELSVLLKTSLNVGSPVFRSYLYDKLKLPPQYDDKEGALTADYEALLKLKKKCVDAKYAHGAAVIERAIAIRALATRARMLSIHADPDGRIRCGYNAVGSETGRVTCYTSPTGSGYNLQTIPDYKIVEMAPGGVLGDRDLFVADDGYWFFQCDLSGADGWTVAAYSKLLGDPTLLDDYHFGLKPANILCLMLRGTKVDFRDRNALKEAAKEVHKKDWDYFACKVGQHGTSYLMGPRTLANKILEDSEGKMYITEKQARDIQNLFLQRYWGVKLWHSYTARRLKQKPEIRSASGHRRVFFGRSSEVLAQALAHEPQNNTTYATNLACLKLWNDSDNRLPNGNIRIETLHQVHDALCGQFRKEDTSWAVSKIKQAFNNTLIIANQPIVIPFEGTYGESWGNMNEGTI